MFCAPDAVPRITLTSITTTVADPRRQERPLINNPVFIYLGTYPNQAAARADDDSVKDLYVAQDIGTYDAAVITKDDAGTVYVGKDEMATRRGVWNGAAVGAVLGILFPPALIATTVVGAAIGGVSGHLWKGLSRRRRQELGEIIDDGQAGSCSLAATPCNRAWTPSNSTPTRSVTKQLDVDSADIDTAIQQANHVVG